MRTLLIGLTGGIGSGKSTVARMLEECGATLVDTDAIARELTAPGGAALPALAAAFGSGMISADGALDRERMRALVFADPKAKTRLEAVVHPMIGERAAELASIAVGTVVFDVPLLAESAQWRARVDRVLVVDCEVATQVKRVMERNAWDEQTVQRVISGQATRAQRRAVADAIICNDGISIADLRTEVRSLWTHWHV